jgi:glycosyltransferase involved in cell wall biosynthesis
VFDGNADADILFQAVSLAASQAEFRLLVVVPDRSRKWLEREALSHATELTSIEVLSDSHVDEELLEGAAGLIDLGSGATPVTPAWAIRAIAAGCPVISMRDSQTIDELLDGGRAGLQVKSKDPRDLAAAILQLLWDGDARLQMAKRASERLEMLSADNVARGIDAVIRAHAGGFSG